MPSYRQSAAVLLWLKQTLKWKVAHTSSDSQQLVRLLKCIWRLILDCDLDKKQMIESVFENREEGFEESSGGFSPVVILNERSSVKSTPTERNLTHLI